ncbi:hypothetical protein ACLIYP_05290, partial [Streptomyces nanhaiensis]
GLDRADEFDLVVADGVVQQRDGEVAAVEQVLPGQQPTVTEAGELSAASEFRAARAPANDGLRRLGVPRRLLRAAAALRVAALLGVLAPTAWLVAELASAPLVR